MDVASSPRFLSMCCVLADVAAQNHRHHAPALCVMTMKRHSPLGCSARYRRPCDVALSLKDSQPWWRVLQACRCEPHWYQANVHRRPRKGADVQKSLSFFWISQIQTFRALSPHESSWICMNELAIENLFMSRRRYNRYYIYCRAYDASYGTDLAIVKVVLGQSISISGLIDCTHDGEPLFCFACCRPHRCIVFEHCGTGVYLSNINYINDVALQHLLPI